MCNFITKRFPSWCVKRWSLMSRVSSWIALRCHWRLFTLFFSPRLNGFWEKVNATWGIGETQFFLKFTLKVVKKEFRNSIFASSVVLSEGTFTAQDENLKSLTSSRSWGTRCFPLFGSWTRERTSEAIGIASRCRCYLSNQVRRCYKYNRPAAGGLLWKMEDARCKLARALDTHSPGPQNVGLPHARAWSRAAAESCRQ